MAYETLIVKKGSTFRVLLRHISDDTWNVIQSADVIEADIAQRTARFATNVTVNTESRTLLITASTDAWAIGAAEMDILIINDGNRIVIPEDGVFKIKVIKTVTIEGDE